MGAVQAGNTAEASLIPAYTRRKFLITCIQGSHVAKALFDRGEHVRVADLNPLSAFAEPICNETLTGNLCESHFCERAVKGIDTVLHFAATMGGMGTIHEGNDLTIYLENSIMTSGILAASIREGIRVFFYASSACVYPEHRQTNTNGDVSLKETHVWAGGIPKPQGHYGLEKLVSELLIQHSSSKIQVRIARFHNIFGPRGAWNNGREKVPAALLRKALSIHLAGNFPTELEIWGDGSQRRSFLFIDDCVEAILKLVESACTVPVNIGSDRSVTIEELGKMAVRCAGLQPEDVKFCYDTGSKPIGVSSRNSNNDFVTKTLGWSPSISLEDGMKQTAEWIRGEIEQNISGKNEGESELTLQMMRCSKLVDLTDSGIKFAILLPITSRGSNPPNECLSLLERFAKSLARTTWRDTQHLGGQGFFIKVYLAIDDDDHFLRETDEQNGMNIAEAVLVSQNICDVTIEVCKHPSGHVCAIWRQIAKRARKDGCDYFVLMGDDVVLKDEGWMRDAHAEFAQLAERVSVPHGFGCVAFTDTSFPGMPTFPIIHRTHIDIFDGDIIPEVFINQDGDPFIYQLYRRWDLDVIIPSFRVQLPFLEPILNLKPSPTCTVMFIIIIDDPQSPARIELETKYAYRPDVRIRTNDRNLGASASRNRGMKESAAEWIIFLDDDVSPRPDLLVEGEKVIRANPNAAGFIGNAQFPPAKSIFTTAVHLAGVTYFWDIATKMTGETDMPWGVTANLITRRIDDGVEYDLQFPKTGGGEDIDFCRRKREFSIANGREGFHPAPEVVVTHPWWNGGSRSYWRFKQRLGPVLRFRSSSRFTSQA